MNRSAVALEFGSGTAAVIEAMEMNLDAELRESFEAVEDINDAAVVGRQRDIEGDDMELGRQGRGEGLEGDFEVVVGKMDIGRKGGVDEGMEAHLVAHVGEVGLPRGAAGDERKCFGEGEMGEMLSLSEGVDDEEVEVVELLFLVGVDMVHIGKVSHCGTAVVLDAVAEDGKVFVHTADGRHGKGAYGEGGAVGDVMKCSFGEPRILVVLEDVAVVVPYGVDGLGVGVDLHISLLYPVKRPDVVEASDVVAVGMGDEDGLEVLNVVVKHLGTEVGADVEEDIVVLVVDEERGGAEPLVTRVVGMAYRTGASNDGHPLRGTGAEKDEFHRLRYES